MGLYSFSETNSMDENKKLYNEFLNWPRCYEYTEKGSVSRKNDIIIIKNWDKDSLIYKQDLKKLSIDENRYNILSIFDNSYLMIGGDKYFFIFDYHDTTKFLMFKDFLNSTLPFAFMRAIKLTDENSFYEETNMDSYKKKIDNFAPNIAKYYNFSIKQINSSSYYTEKFKNGNLVDYKSDYLNLILLVQDYWSDWLSKNPWVPGKEKNTAGIGEYLTIEFTEPKDNILVLNGYVELEKRYLYKANNRIKTAVIKSLDEKNPFEIEYTFEDYVHFAEIDFPAKVSKVQFIIKDVYKGEKWNDTCVSAVITRYDAN